MPLQLSLTRLVMIDTSKSDERRLKLYFEYCARAAHSGERAIGPVHA
jgi:hypothetical protein